MTKAPDLSRPVVIGTRGSDLALWQAHHVRDLLRARWGEALTVELTIIKTTGDAIQDRPLAEIGGKGLFVKAIEEQLLDARVDLAVHSMKDLPAFSPEGLAIAASPVREDPRDAVVGPAGATLRSLPAGTRLGTGSLRRGALAKRINPDLEVVPIRGNVPTRVGKVDSGELDAVMLAAAGLTRLGMADRIAEYLDVDAFCPAPAQGILALQCREDDPRTRAIVSALGEPDAMVAAAAERGFVQRLGAGCTVPMGCHARIDGAHISLSGLVVHPSGHPCYSAQTEGPRQDAAELGAMVADAVLALGAEPIVRPN